MCQKCSNIICRLKLVVFAWAIATIENDIPNKYQYSSNELKYGTCMVTDGKINELQFMIKWINHIL